MRRVRSERRRRRRRTAARPTPGGAGPRAGSRRRPGLRARPRGGRLDLAPARRERSKAHRGQRKKDRGPAEQVAAALQEPVRSQLEREPPERGRDGRHVELAQPKVGDDARPEGNEQEKQVPGDHGAPERVERPERHSRRASRRERPAARRAAGSCTGRPRARRRARAGDRQARSGRSSGDDRRTPPRRSPAGLPPS